MTEMFHVRRGVILDCKSGIYQGLFNIVLTKNENKLLQKENQTTTFVGATAGIVF